MWVGFICEEKKKQLQVRKTMAAVEISTQMLQCRQSACSCHVESAQKKNNLHLSLLSLIVFIFLPSHRYYVCVTLLIYFLPLCIMGCAYTTVGVTLWASEIPGDSSQHYREQLLSKRKVMQTHTHHSSSL